MHRLSFLAKAICDFSQMTSDRDSDTASKKKRKKKKMNILKEVFLFFLPIMRLFLLIMTKINSDSF